jgi:hypothetical protein
LASHFVWRIVGISRNLLAAIALLALAAFPPAALAATVVPPGNSAANQYTETFPTAGGNTEAKKGKVTPGDVLGSANAKKLDSQGRQGREAAAVVAATAPPPAVDSEGEGSGGPTANGGGNGNGGGGGSGAGSGGGDGTTAAGTGSGSAAGSGREDDLAGVEEASGSSGFGEVLGQATGSTTSGGTGLLLPLAVLATAVWALVYLLRRNRPTA